LNSESQLYEYLTNLQIPVIIKKSFKKKHDRMIQEYVKMRDNEMCILSDIREGCVGSPTSGHHSLVKRRILKWRWHPLNVYSLCPECHALDDIDPVLLERLIIMAIQQKNLITKCEIEEIQQSA
jgi:hypothetical protein